MPRNLIFVAPFPTDPTMRFVRAVRKLDDVRLFGVVHTPPSGDDAHLYDDMVRVTEPLALKDVLEGVEVLRRRHGEPVRILGILEAMMVQLAQARERYGVAGTTVKIAELFREKALMKDALRAAGLPVARHKLIASEKDARAFAEEVGFPIVLKPPAGMGAKATFRVSSLETLISAVTDLRVGPNAPVLAEEMLRGREHSFETITVGREPRVYSFAQYFPGPLEVLETPWIQWACVLPREVDTALHDKARAIGVSAIRALGLEDGMTHMEWYEKADGSIAVGEIAQRPPGPQLCQMTGLVHDIDIYRAWARAVVDGELDAPWERKYAAGTAFIRGMGKGRVAAVTGVRETHEAIAPWLVEAKLPTIGAPKGDSYEGDGYVVVRAETTAKVQELIKTIVHTIKVHYVS
ncbi:MAG: Carbamoylphosphate synthase large subunit protein [Labilithrix sp.]|nr:Carbamoylphosphate synthase large subunit protein [Labilithrix sp.]